MRKIAFYILCTLSAFSGVCQPNNPEEVLLSLPVSPDSIRQLQLKSVAIYSATKVGDSNKKLIVYRVAYKEGGNKTKEG